MGLEPTTFGFPFRCPPDWASKPDTRMMKHSRSLHEKWNGSIQTCAWLLAAGWVWAPPEVTLYLSYIYLSYIYLSTVLDHPCVRLTSSVGRASERGSWVWVPRETDFISWIEKPEHNIECHMYHLIPHQTLINFKGKGKWSNQWEQYAKINTTLCKGWSKLEI